MNVEVYLHCLPFYYMLCHIDITVSYIPTVFAWRLSTDMKVLVNLFIGN